MFAVPTIKELDPVTGSHHFVPTVRSSRLLAQADSPPRLSERSESVPFLVGTYTVANLPATILFNGEKMRYSFKPNTHYTFIVAVFSKAMVSFVLAFSYNYSTSLIITFCRKTEVKNFIHLAQQPILLFLSVSQLQ